MKILVIGSCGFIGSNVISFFQKKGNEVSSCDVINAENRSSKFFLLQKDNPDFEKLFITQKYDVCINASGSPSVNFSIENPFQDFNLNVVNVFKILEAIRKHNPSCRFLNLSSAAVYGNPSRLPVNETHPLNPLSPYGFHKQMAEKICNEFFNLFSIGTCSLRVFSAYGPGLKKQLFWDIYQKSRSSNEIELFGTGDETRDFIFIEDLLQAIDIVVSKDLFSGNVFNTSSGTETTIRDVVNIFTNNVNPHLQIKFNGVQKKGDPLNWRADISLLQSLGFNPQTPLENGIKKYALWLKEN